MRRFYLPILFILLLGTCTLDSSKEDGQPDGDEEEEDEENPDNDDMDTDTDSTEKKQTGNNSKKDEEKEKEKCKKKKKNNKHCEEERSGGEDQPVTSKMSTRTPSSTSTEPPTRTPSSTSTEPPTRTPISTSAGPPTRTPSSTSTGNPTSAPVGSDMVAIFVPVSIFLFLLVLLVAVFLWRYSDRSQCLRRFGGKVENTVKIKPGNDVITVYATASHPQDSEPPGQSPPSGHIYQEISDVHMGVSGPGSSYSTVGFPFQDQKAAAQQPADGQYSLVGLPAK